MPPMAIQTNDLLQATTTALVGLLIFLTLGHRSNMIECRFVRPSSPGETQSNLRRRINGGGLLLLSVFVLLAISVILSLFDMTFDIAKITFIFAIVVLIVRIALHDRYSPRE